MPWQRPKNTSAIMSKWAEAAIVRRLTVTLWGGQAAPLVRYHKANGFFAPRGPMKPMQASLNLLNQPIGRREVQSAVSNQGDTLSVEQKKP